jgi:hypothetical protein
MSSSAIFVCHDCQEAYGTCCQFPKGENRLKAKEVMTGEKKHQGFFLYEVSWLEKHLYHDAEILGDAYGWFSSCDYNFETREFDQPEV